MRGVGLAVAAKRLEGDDGGAGKIGCLELEDNLGGAVPALGRELGSGTDLGSVPLT